MKPHKLYLAFGILVLTLSLVVNIFISLSEGHYIGVLSFRNLYLIALLTCFILDKRLIIGLLAILTVVFFYFAIREIGNPYISNYDHPVANFTYGWGRMIYESLNRGMGTFISRFLPLILHVLILFYDLPFRVIKVYKSRNEGLGKK